MIYKNLLISFILVIPFFMNAQTVRTSQGQFEYEDQMRTTVKAEIAAPAKEVKGAWEDFLKKNYDVKLKGFGFLANKDMLTAEQTTFNALSDKTMDFYSHFSEDDGLTSMHVFAAYGYDYYINPEEYPEQYKQLMNITERFVSDFAPDYFADIVDEAQDEVDDLKDELEDDRKEIEKLRKDIEKLQEDISEKEESLTKAQQTLQDAKSQMTSVKNELSKL